MAKTNKILMVCLGNICRSPMAEGIMRKKLHEQKIAAEVDSAGTSGLHVGENPDHRAIKIMNHYHTDISNIIARKFQKSDFDQFDLILAMDDSNYEDIFVLASDQESKDKVKLILKYTNRTSHFSVPDPWYGNMDGFEKVYHLLNDACEQVIKSHFI